MGASLAGECCFRKGVPSEYSIVVGLDINGTVMEGDSLSGDCLDMSLTRPALELLKALDDVPARIVFFTFGCDADKLLAGLPKSDRRYFPPENFFFIARAAESAEVWAFPMPRSKYIDFGAANPKVKDCAVAEIRPLACMSEYAVGAEAYRFKDSKVFGSFVDTLLRVGDAVFRAAYSPDNAYFRGRKGESDDKPTECKLLVSSKPILAFDDHADDWGIDIPTDDWRVVPVVSPMVAGDKAPTNMVAELKQFVSDRDLSFAVVG